MHNHEKIPRCLHINLIILVPHAFIRHFTALCLRTKQLLNEIWLFCTAEVLATVVRDQCQLHPTALPEKMVRQ
jgi:hypothetical protein